MEALNSNFRYVGIGQAVKDKPEDSYDLEITMVEAMPSLEGDYNEKEKINLEYQDIKGNTTNLSLDKSKSVTAKWIGLYNSNRLTAPDVVIGEMVHLFQQGGNDEYFWASTGINMRKKEKVIYYFSNKNQSDVNIAKGEEGYYFMVDTKNKELVLHTANNDGEASAYDLVINTEEGKVTLVDVQGNYFELLSPEGKLNVRINQDITISHDNNLTMDTGANRKHTIGGNSDTTVGGSSTYNTSGSTTNTTGGTYTIQGSVVQIN
jgi:hypothetical protein